MSPCNFYILRSSPYYLTLRSLEFVFGLKNQKKNKEKKGIKVHKKGKEKPHQKKEKEKTKRIRKERNKKKERRKREKSVVSLSLLSFIRVCLSYF